MQDLFTIFLIQSILWLILFILLFRFVRINNRLKKRIDQALEKSDIK